MPLPIDIPELLKIATDLKEVQNTPLSVSVYIDDSADDELVGHVRSKFAAAGAHTRVTIGYITNDAISVNTDDDMVVIIAGGDKTIGERASHIRGHKVPVMVVTNEPSLVSENARESGYAIPEADIVSPLALDKVAIVEENAAASIPFVGNKIANVIRAFNVKNAEKHCESEVHGAIGDEGAQGINDGAGISLEDSGADAGNACTPDGKILLTPETEQVIDKRMGEWILAACSEKKLAFALAFPFVRRPLALDSVSSTSFQNAAVGFVPIIPGADMPIMTLNQAKMVLQISTAYGKPLDADRIKEIAAVVAGGFLFRNIARSLTKIIPGAGWVISGVIAFVSTEAMGRAVIEYFEAGGDIVGVAQVMQTARDKAVVSVRKASATPAGKKLIEMVKNGADGVMSSIRSE